MGFLSLDGTFWLQLINFAIFFAILNVVFLKPVGRAVAKRREYIDGLTRGYDAASAELRELQGEIEGKRIAARRDAEGVISKARAASSNETAAIAADYSTRVQTAVEEAHQKVAGELQAARTNEDAAVGELSALILGRVFSGGTRG